MGLHGCNWEELAPFYLYVYCAIEKKIGIKRTLRNCLLWPVWPRACSEKTWMKPEDIQRSSWSWQNIALWRYRFRFIQFHCAVTSGRLARSMWASMICHIRVLSAKTSSIFPRAEHTTFSNLNEIWGPPPLWEVENSNSCPYCLQITHMPFCYLVVLIPQYGLPSPPSIS